MSLEFVAVRGRGQSGEERLVLKARAGCDVGRFAVFCARREGEKVLADVRAAFWFPDKMVKAGDLLVIYTKIGNSSEKKLEDGGTSHFFYWDREEAVWGTDKVAVVVVEVARWTSYFPQSSEQASLELGGATGA